MSALKLMENQNHSTRDSSRFLDAFLSALKSRIITHKPFFLAHATTYGCNSKCRTCTYWQLTPRMKEDVPTGEVYELLDETYDFGSVAFPHTRTLTTTQPLMTGAGEGWLTGSWFSTLRIEFSHYIL